MTGASPVHRLAPIAREPLAVRLLLTAVAVAFISLFVLLPLIMVFTCALADGAGPYWAALQSPETWSAIKLTLRVAAVVVPLNTLFGIAAAWLVARYDFVGRSVLVTLIDLPFSVSPVIAGLLFVLLFGKSGLLGSWLSAHQIQILFAVPGLMVATAFVTFAMVARELISVMEAQGPSEEEAALTLGASGWQVLRHVTLPKLRWSLLTGVILCNARAMGEFGAVSVVSGHIRGMTNTLPLHVEILFNEYNFVGAFAVATLLALLGLVTLLVKRLVHASGSRE